MGHAVNDIRLQRHAERLHAALLERRPIDPLTQDEPSITVEDAYLIQRHLIARRVATGEKVIGKKIGVTSQVVMDMLGVHQPDFGVLTDAMRYADGSAIDASSLIQPKAEGEIAFLLRRDLPSSGVGPADVLEATESVMACFEVVDSRIRDWKIRIQDTVADNASCGAFVLGEQRFDPRQVDLVGCRMSLTKNGQVAASGQGAATMGSPLTAMAWLANTMGALGMPLRAGEAVLSGALGAMVPVKAGDALRVDIEGLGHCTVRFA